jgi:hypothetical protein
MARVLVCGGRDFADRAMLRHHLDLLYRVGWSAVIHGGATGADTLAGEWAALRGIPVEVYPADWRRYGRMAGPMRNQRMLTDGAPDLVVAFPGGAGTADMVRRATDAGVPVYHTKVIE